MHACHTPRFLLFDKAQAAIHLSVWQGRERCIIGRVLLLRGVGVTCYSELYIIVYEQRQFSLEGRQMNPFNRIATRLHACCTLSYWDDVCVMISCHI